MTTQTASQPIRRDEALALARRNAHKLRKLGVVSVGLFGSVARDEAGAGSDVDVLVEIEPKTFDRYMDVKFFLEELFGLPVDLVMQGAVTPRMRALIERDLLLVA